MGEALPLPEHISERVPQRALGLLPDARLARLAAEGSRGAFTAIYERHHQALYRYCRSILGNEEEAKDALQNTMVSALRALPGERRAIALKPWLFRVAHNEAISVLRRRSPEASIDEVGDVAAIEADSSIRDRLRSLFEDLHELPDRQRGALVMRELNGLSYSDIGTALDTSQGAAKQIVYEARCALHQLEEGREMACKDARRSISARDGRMLRGRKLRAHLRTCDDCRSFRDSIGGRRTDLRALAPPLPAPAAAAILSGVLGGGGGAGGGIAALVGGAAGQSVAGSAALKATAIAVATGLGIVGAGVLVGPDNPVSSAAIDKKPVTAWDKPSTHHGGVGAGHHQDASSGQGGGSQGGSGANHGSSPSGGANGGGESAGGDAGGSSDQGASSVGDPLLPRHRPRPRAAALPAAALPAATLPAGARRAAARPPTPGRSAPRPGTEASHRARAEPRQVSSRSHRDSAAPRRARAASHRVRPSCRFPSVRWAANRTATARAAPRWDRSPASRPR